MNKLEYHYSELGMRPALAIRFGQMTIYWQLQGEVPGWSSFVGSALPSTVDVDFVIQHSAVFRQLEATIPRTLEAA